MNKLTKLGVSALCGSLAAVSAAQAGEISVSGGATATHVKKGYGETGNPIGMATSLTFKGSGELDNGNAVTLTIDHDDQNAFSAAQITYATGLGVFSFDQGGGTGIDRYDDMMPTAWEETTGTGVDTGLRTVSGAGGGTDIELAIDSSMLPDGMAAYIAYSPKADGGKANDKASTGATGDPVNGAGWDIAFDHTGLADGLKVFGGYSSIAQGGQDRGSKVLGATYAVGSVTVGYQWSLDNVSNASTDAYENQAFGVSFSVNDDLSMSYGYHESEIKDEAGVDGGRTVEAHSFQVAYSMGGATIKLAETSVDNALYNSTSANDRDGTSIALSLAF